MGIASSILIIIGLILGITIAWAPLGLILEIIALILAIVDTIKKGKSGEKKGASIARLIISVIMIITIIIIIGGGIHLINKTNDSLIAKSKEVFNESYETYRGEQTGYGIKNLLSTIDSNELIFTTRTITCFIDGNAYNGESDKDKILNDNKYNVDLGYDEEGYIDAIHITTKSINNNYLENSQMNTDMQKLYEDTNKKNESEDLGLNSLNKDWKNYQFQVNGKTLKLPMSYTELANTAGFKIKAAYEDTNIPVKHYAIINLYKDDKLALYTEIYNDTEADIKCVNGKVTRVSQTNYQIKSGANALTFPGGLQAGMKMTKDKLISILGEPTSSIRRNNNDKETYKYNANTNWTTTNYYEIVILNGVIDQITLDNRK